MSRLGVELTVGNRETLAFDAVVDASPEFLPEDWQDASHGEGIRPKA